MALGPVLEVKRTLAGVEKRFECQLIEGDAEHAVVLWISPAPMQVHGVDLPQGTISFGYFWTDRFYNAYHWLDPCRRTLGIYFNIADDTRIAAGLLAWRDLTVDVLATPSGRLEVLDEHELPAELEPAVRSHLDAGLRAILSDPTALRAEIESRSRALWPRAFPDAA